MNEIIQSLYNRKSVRVYTEQPVSADDKELLLDAAIQAPTAGNQVMYSIIDVTDPAVKLALSKSCDNQPFIATAPLVLVFVADLTRWHRSFELHDCHPRKLGVGDLMLAISDTVIAAQNMVVAAERLGLGSCYIGDILENCEIHRELLQLPEHAVPACMLVLGYPTEQQKMRKKPARFDKQYLVGQNVYPHLTDAELNACFIDQRQRDNPNNTLALTQAMQAFCKRKFNSSFSMEMTRSVKKYLESFL